MSGWVRITVLDLETGEEEAVEIRDDYVLVAVGECYVSHTTVHATGTHVLTVKNSKGEKREVQYKYKAENPLYQAPSVESSKAEWEASL